ncbi:hypothetical protein M405DRAFT_56284 [Rhizopogon salebrosus TDB-379]|nr:hypothetical protein M405DRAFT_56284 [Rhizopogon salebrosus TDB-379]
MHTLSYLFTGPLVTGTTEHRKEACQHRARCHSAAELTAYWHSAGCRTRWSQHRGSWRCQALATASLLWWGQPVETLFLLVSVICPLSKLPYRRVIYSTTADCYCGLCRRSQSPSSMKPCYRENPRKDSLDVDRRIRTRFC